MATTRGGAEGLDPASERRAAESLYPGHWAPRSQPIPEGVDLSKLETEIKQADSLDSSERMRLLSYVRELAFFHSGHRVAPP
jgi:hypothetical protein